MRTIIGWTVSVLFLGAAAAGCGRDWEAEYNQLQSEHEQTQAELRTAQQRITELEQQNRELSAVLESQGADLSDLTALRERLQSELAAARAREEANRTRLDSLRRMAMAFREMSGTVLPSTMWNTSRSSIGAVG